MEFDGIDRKVKMLRRNAGIKSQIDRVKV